MVIGQNGGVTIMMRRAYFPRGTDRVGMDAVSIMAFELRVLLPNLFRIVNGVGSSTHAVPLHPDEVGTVAPTRKKAS